MCLFGETSRFACADLDLTIVLLAREPFPIFQYVTRVCLHFVPTREYAVVGHVPTVWTAR